MLQLASTQVSPALLANIRLGSNCLLGRNSVACESGTSVKGKKFYNVDVRIWFDYCTSGSSVQLFPGTAQAFRAKIRTVKLLKSSKSPVSSHPQKFVITPGVNFIKLFFCRHRLKRPEMPEHLSLTSLSCLA